MNFFLINIKKKFFYTKLEAQINLKIESPATCLCAPNVNVSM